MSDEEQVEILQVTILEEEGVEAWNKWRKDNPDIEINLRRAYLLTANLREANLRGADLRGACLEGANLRGANLRGACLEGADLREADLRETNLEGANLEGADLREVNLEGVNLFEADLKGANLEGANLEGADLREADLRRADLRGADLFKADLNGTDLRRADLFEADLRIADFREADLSGANLRRADLRRADLRRADLRRADLSGAKLKMVQALATNFNSVTLTGACIEDWVINNQTNLDNINCDYVYLKEDQQERRPSDPNRNFEAGEFAKLVAESTETGNLIFRKGVNWQAFAYSFKKAQILNKDTPLAIQSIENKGDGVVLIKVNVPQNADKNKIESDFWQGYELTNKTLKEQYETRLLDKDKNINQLFYFINQTQEKLDEIPKLMAEQPKVQQTFNTPVTGVAGNVESNQNVYAPEQKQTLAEAATEIQDLLKQLKKTNPHATEDEEIAYINDETSRSFKRQVAAALKTAGKTAIDDVFQNPYVKVGKAAIMTWIEP